MSRQFEGNIFANLPQLISERKLIKFFDGVGGEGGLGLRKKKHHGLLEK